MLDNERIRMLIAEMKDRPGVDYPVDALSTRAGLSPSNPCGRFARIADFFGRLSFPVYMSHFMFMWVFRYYVVQYSAKVSLATNVCAFAGAYMSILAIGYGVMKFWEKSAVEVN